jgi:hypothetical protein
MRSIHVVMTMAASAALLAGCSSEAPEHPSVQTSALDKVSDVQEIVGRVGVVAEDSLYSCLLNSLMQGLPLAQAQAECATKLVDDDHKGFGGPLGEISKEQASFFDPQSVSGACGWGDSETGKGTTTETYPMYGTFSYGGKASETENGLSRKESLALKEAAVAARGEALKELATALAAEKAAREDAEKKEHTVDAKKAKEALAAAEADTKAKEEAAKKAKEEANKDPNKKPAAPPPSKKEPGPGVSACDQALASARELVRECQRTSWKSYSCQQVLARLNGCADPALILVDPEQGYTCGSKPDPEAVKNAVIARCEERVKVGPDGRNPCEPLSFESSSRIAHGNFGDVCDNPEAYRDPDSAACLGTFQGGGYFGQPDIQQIIIVALEKLGGPLIVIAPPPPPGVPRG